MSLEGNTALSQIPIDDTRRNTMNISKPMVPPARGGEIALESCTACDLVKDCSLTCQERHRTQHTETCMTRADELKDEALFSNGLECYLGECSICTLPMPLHPGEVMKCKRCMNSLCIGCIATALKFECPFCRHPYSRDDAANVRLLQKHVDNGKAEAMFVLGEDYVHGQNGLRMDTARGFELMTKAANLGHVNAHYILGGMYCIGEVGLGSDMAKAVQHWEIAATAGHPTARLELGIMEWNTMNYGRALKHLTIAAKMGEETALKKILTMHELGKSTKDEYAEALDGYQQAAEELKSDQRERARLFLQSL